MKSSLLFELRAAPDAPFLAGGLWRFRAGEQWVVTGPNGSGKSHLAALLAGEVPPRSIELEFAPAIEGRVAMVSFEQQREQAAHGWLQERWHWHDAHREDGVAAFLSYDSVHEINPFEVGREEPGARRAFARRSREIVALLARAMLGRPDLLLLDEPCLNLDRQARQAVLAQFERLFAERPGLAVVYVAHRLEDVPDGITHTLRLTGGKAS